eukprot:4046682-Pyramimonas_sp.AAC.1
MPRAAMKIPDVWPSAAAKTSCLVVAAVMTSTFTAMARVDGAGRPSSALASPWFHVGAAPVYLMPW